MLRATEASGEALAETDDGRGHSYAALMAASVAGTGSSRKVFDRLNVPATLDSDSSSGSW